MQSSIGDLGRTAFASTSLPRCGADVGAAVGAVGAGGFPGEVKPSHNHAISFPPTVQGQSQSHPAVPTSPYLPSSCNSQYGGSNLEHQLTAALQWPSTMYDYLRWHPNYQSMEHRYNKIYVLL